MMSHSPGTEVLISCIKKIHRLFLFLHFKVANDEGIRSLTVAFPGLPDCRAWASPCSRCLVGTQFGLDCFLFPFPLRHLAPRIRQVKVFFLRTLPIGEVPVWNSQRARRWPGAVRTSQPAGRDKMSQPEAKGPARCRTAGPSRGSEGKTLRGPWEGIWGPHMK